MKPKHDVTKLPKWAQTYIAGLERNLQTLKAERASVKHGTSPISYFVIPDFDQTHYLPEHAKLTFSLGAQDFINVSLGDGVLNISTSGRMAIKPRHSNAVWVENDKG